MKHFQVPVTELEWICNICHKFISDEGMSAKRKVILNIEGMGISDRGKVRTNNEDAFLVRDDLALYILADGMGGAAAGEVASNQFVQVAEEIFLSGIRRREHRRALVLAAFEEAHSRIQANAQRFPSQAGMGCTAEILTFEGDRYFLGHVGDSRTYLFDGKTLRQLTLDHTYIQKQVDVGVLTHEMARHHRLRHILSRAVGYDEHIKVDYHSGQIKPDSLFLLCSDGLTDELSDDQIAKILKEQSDLTQRTQQLVDTAKQAGGRDNITVVLSHVAGNNKASGPMGIRRLWNRY